MESQNKYLGDDKFQKFLEHYNCPTPLGVVKMKFVGALCSPNMNLRPTDVISSFWPDGRAPRLETKEEADLFFKFFMGLWDDMFEKIRENSVRLEPKFKKTESEAELLDLCRLRFDETEFGFIEGFWGGQETLKLPAYLAQLMDSMSQMAEIYSRLLKKIEAKADLAEIQKHLKATDAMIEKTISFVVENSVLPRIESLQRTVH